MTIFWSLKVHVVFLQEQLELGNNNLLDVASLAGQNNKVPPVEVQELIKHYVAVVYNATNLWV